MAVYHLPKIATDGLMLYIDAANPKSYSGSGSQSNDLSGNNNHGTLDNQVTYSSNNKGFFTFDGIDDRILTSYNPTFTDFTIITWFKSISIPNSFNIYDVIIDKDYIDGIWMGKGTLNNSWGGGVVEPNDPYGRYITLEENQWHMLTSRRNGTSHTICGDGIDNSVTGTVPSTPVTNVPFAFGNYTTGFENSGVGLNGNISVVQIYNRALSDQEIQQNFNALRGRYGI